MAKFAVRPEINGAVDGDYEKLHDAMYKSEFYRVILGRKGEGVLKWYDLPSGMYVGDKPITLNQAYIQAEAAVQTVANAYKPNKGHELIIFEYSAASMNLKLNTDRKKLPPGANPNC